MLRGGRCGKSGRGEEGGERCDNDFFSKEIVKRLKRRMTRGREGVDGMEWGVYLRTDFWSRDVWNVGYILLFFSPKKDWFSSNNKTLYNFHYPPTFAAFRASKSICKKQKKVINI